MKSAAANTHHSIDGIGGSRKQPTKGRHIPQRLQSFDGGWPVLGASRSAGLDANNITLKLTKSQWASPGFEVKS
jgi:hypothetical protein